MFVKIENRILKIIIKDLEEFHENLLAAMYASLKKY